VDLSRDKEQRFGQAAIEHRGCNIHWTIDITTEEPCGTKTKVMSEKDSQIRATAYRHAQSFEEKKAVRNRVADLVVELFDLPAPDADPAYPQPSDSSLFKQGLSLFQPSDFDDLVRERNIDDRCGYVLCPRPNVKVQGGQNTVWNGKGGKDFCLVPKADLEKWCSKECGDRAIFARAQLSKEPAWNRETSHVDVKLLDEVQRAREKSNRETSEANVLTGSLENMSLGDAGLGGRPMSRIDLADQLRELALERGELGVTDKAAFPVVEILNTAAPEPPVLDEGDMIEGHRIHQAK
jgi:RNA polymerase II-associated protein 2